ncbi:MAG: T9SS type A sorting domain-containing protein [Bacteroidales bacterium]|nr:T9SS type A sorting domain-containing protein [Bacteroidales bacterium]
MRILTIILAIFIECNSVYAQSSFFTYYPSNTYEYSYSAIETLEGYFIITGLIQIPDGNSPEQAYTMKIEQSGEKISELIEPIAGDTTMNNVFIVAPPQEPNNYFLITNKFYLSQTGEYCQSVNLRRINDDLQIISSKSFLSNPNNYILPQAYSIVEDSVLYILSSAFLYLPNFQPIGWSVTKYNFEPDSLATYNYYPTYYSSVPFGLLFNPKSNSIKCFDGMGYLSTLVTNLNKNLNFINTASLPSLVTTACASYYTDSSYLLTGVVNNLLNVKQHLIIHKINSGDEVLKNLEYYNSQDTILYGGAVKNTVVIGDKIFVVGNYNVNPSQWPWQNSPTWIQITRIDSGLNIIDHHFYGGDAFYMPYNIIATSDGGALITGNRYDYHYPDIKKYHIFALKVNSEGLITEIPEDASWQISDAIVCPNPGNEYFDAIVGIQHPTSTLYVYDMNGKLVFKNKLNQVTSRIKTGSLPYGTYLYKFVSKNKVIGNGKWIKMRD